MAHWLIQRGFDSDRQYLKLISILERMGIPHSFCTVIPFAESDEGIRLESELPSTENIFTYGSYSLSKHAVRRGYFPGAFISKNSDISNLLKYYGNHLLNSDCYVAEIKNPVWPHWEKLFIKPNSDTKAFTAEVVTQDEFIKFREGILNADPKVFATVTPETEYVASAPKSIEAEFRFFVVDGKVITYSQYVSGGRFFAHPHVDEYIVKFAQDMVDIYQPDRAFVIDIAITEGELKIIEVNSINSAGLYLIDVQKFVNAIEDMLP